MLPAKSDQQPSAAMPPIAKDDDEDRMEVDADSGPSNDVTSSTSKNDVIDRYNHQLVSATFLNVVFCCFLVVQKYFLPIRRTSSRL